MTVDSASYDEVVRVGTQKLLGLDADQVARAIHARLIAIRGRAKVRIFNLADVRKALREHFDQAAVSDFSKHLLVTRMCHVVARAYAKMGPPMSDIVEITSSAEDELIWTAERGRARSAPYGNGATVVTRRKKKDEA